VEKKKIGTLENEKGRGENLGGMGFEVDARGEVRANFKSGIGEAASGTVLGERKKGRNPQKQRRHEGRRKKRKARGHCIIFGRRVFIGLPS